MQTEMAADKTKVTTAVSTMHSGVDVRGLNAAAAVGRMNMCIRYMP